MTQQLNPGTNTFAPSGWSGVGIAAGEALEVSTRFQRITGGLDQSLVAGIKSLDFNTGAHGVVGGPDDGPLIIDADDGVGGDARVRNVGKVDLFIQAGGPNNLVENIHTGNPRARTRLMGGAFGINSISSGKVTATGSTILTDFYALGGDTRISYGATGGTLANLVQTAGKVWLNRKCTTIVVGEGGVLDLDPDSAVVQTGVSIILYGGRINWWGGEVPDIQAFGGVIDYRVARGSIGSALGATRFNVAGTQIIPNPDVNLSNMVDLGAIFRTESGPVQFNNGTQNAPQ